MKVNVSLPELPCTVPPAARSAWSTVKVVATLKPAFSTSTLVRLTRLRSIAAAFTSSVSVPVLPVVVVELGKVVAIEREGRVDAEPAFRISTLFTVVLVRSIAVPEATSVSIPLPSVTEPPDTRSACSSVNVVARLEPAFRISTLANVVLLRLKAVP